MLSGTLHPPAAFLRSREEAKREAGEALERGRALIAGKVPAWAKSVIVAEYEEDRCDTMTDYFATKTTKTLVLGFSKHNRDLFSELRKAVRLSGVPAIQQFAVDHDQAASRNAEKDRP